MSGIREARRVMGRRGGRRALVLLAGLLLSSASACFVGYGFAGGGLPTNIRTAAVLPFENETPVAELPRDIAELLRTQLDRRLGLRSAPEARANAVVRGTILRYDADIPVAYSSDPSQATSARRRLAIVLDVEIVEQATGRILFARRGLRGEGEYAEGAEAAGRRTAIERIVATVIEGAQSQW
jgi:hypothetical protein